MQPHLQEMPRMEIIPRQRLSCQAKAPDKTMAIPGNNVPGDDQPGWEIATKSRGLILTKNKQKKEKISKAVECMF